MRILALETNVEKLKKQFIAEGEEVLLSSTHHIFSFLFPMFWVCLLTVFFIAAGVTATTMEIVGPSLSAFLLLLWLLVFLYRLIDSLIEWRLHFLIVTTEKVVIIHHHFIFHQDITPLHLENIVSTRSESRFFGIGNCGIVHLTLEQKKDLGQSQEMSLEYIPKPSTVAGAIENAIVLKKQRVPIDQGPEGQSQKIEEVREKTGEENKEHV